MTDVALSVFAAARDAPDRDALVFEDATWSWATLAEQVAARCASLDALGVCGGQRVAVRAHNSPEAVATLLALMELRATAVLLHPRLTDPEARALLADASPHHALDALAPLMPARLDAGAPDAPERAPLAMLYTSGTTGHPKAAMLPASAFVASAAASARNLVWRDDDRWLLCLPVCHVGGLSVLTRSLLARRCVVLHARFEPDAVLASVVRDRATLLSVVPTMLRALLERDAANALARLRVVLVGGAATPPALLETCAMRRVRALTTYGLTEACSQVTTQRLPPDDAPFTLDTTSGVALDGVTLSIVDEDGNPAATGEVGLLRVRGASVMTGYWRRDPLGDAWLETGDLASLDDAGRLTVHARRTDLIVTGGENVYPAEVEAVLGALPGVAAALVFGVDDARWGQVVAAALVREGDAARDEAAWLASTAQALCARLASHKRPRRVCVVEALPMRATGKVDRAEGVRRFRGRTRAWTHRD